MKIETGRFEAEKLKNLFFDAKSEDDTQDLNFYGSIPILTFLNQLINSFLQLIRIEK
jgi:hypothetical protein